MFQATPDVATVEWRDIPGYEGLYKVSDTGLVWSVPRATTRGGLIAQRSNKAGYIFVTLAKDGAQRRFFVHRLVLAAFNGPCPAGQEVRHLDGNRGNNWRQNLKYGTRAENVQDILRHGRNVNANKTHCPKNHEYTPENTWRQNGGGRVCLACKRARARERMRRKRQQLRDAGEIPKYSDLPEEEKEKIRKRAREYQRRKHGFKPRKRAA